MRLFSVYGEVNSVQLVRDKLNNRSRGRAFVDMPIEAQGKKAILQLNRQNVNGKNISVSEVTYNPGYNSYEFRVDAS
jgi:RNA recognition motif-containing protein